MQTTTLHIHFSRRAGTAGSLLPLGSPKAQARVLVLEAGASTPLPEIAVPAAGRRSSTPLELGRANRCPVGNRNSARTARGAVSEAHPPSTECCSRGDIGPVTTRGSRRARRTGIRPPAAVFKRSESSRAGDPALRGVDDHSWWDRLIPPASSSTPAFRRFGVRASSAPTSAAERRGIRPGRPEHRRWQQAERGRRLPQPGFSDARTSNWR